MVESLLSEPETKKKKDKDMRETSVSSVDLQNVISNRKHSMAASKTDESESERQRNKEVGTQCCTVVKMF